MENKTCKLHYKKEIPYIRRNFQGCITPHPNPGVHFVWMCPSCWEAWLERKKQSSFGW